MLDSMRSVVGHWPWLELVVLPELASCWEVVLRYSLELGLSKSEAEFNTALDQLDLLFA